MNFGYRFDKNSICKPCLFTMNRSIPAFLVATDYSSITDCSRWRQLGQKPLFIHEVSLQQLALFPHIAVEKVLALDFAANHNSSLYPYCYALPLFAGQLEAHREYCRQAMNENKEPTKKACLAFGIVSIHKWIQITEDAAWVLYYQQMSAPVDECRKRLLSLQNDEKALLATRTLREQTGCSFAALCPQTVFES